MSLFAGAFALLAQGNVVWQIGKFDHTAAEFGGGSEGAVVVDATAADAARRWPGSHGATRNATREIRFRLADAPAGTYALDLAVLAGYPRTPRLELELNGAAGSAFFDRVLSYHAEGRADSPVCTEARTRVPLPAAALRPGDNVLRITAVDDAPDENNDSVFSWDALALVRLNAPAEAAVAVEPTFFYAGQKEVVTVIACGQRIKRLGSRT